MLAASSILFPTDFSPSSQRAFDICVLLARATGASVCIVHAFDDPEITDPVFRKRVLTRRAKEAESVLQELVERTSDDDLEVHSRLHVGLPSDEAILQEADARSADLIVLGAYGRRGLRDYDIGPTARMVLRHASCPVLTVKGDTDAHAQMESTAQVESAFPRVLIPTDFSEPSRIALDYASDVCDLFQSTAVVLHVVEEFVPPAIYGLDVNPIRSMSEKIEERARAEMERITAGFASKGIAVQHQVAMGHAPSEIISFVETKEIDLVVIASRGSRLERFVIGSVADKVVLGAPCSVLTLKPK